MPRLSRASYWQLRLARWPRRPPAGSLRPGYTLLLPVPGDIPVFLELALQVCAWQQAAHRVTTLVIPDRPSPAIERIVEKARPDWPGPLDIALIPRPERWVLPYMNSGSRNHGLQVVAGVSSSRSSHVVLHDADLFILDPSLHDSQYVDCRARHLACLGVGPVWDGWFREKGLRLTATWEMVAAVDWLRRFPPHRHIGHDDDLLGEPHTFDTTLFAQACTPPGEVDWVDRGADFVHFNYVISTYRHFQRQGTGFVDANFRLLLIAFFVHLFSHGPPPSGLPSLAELAQRLGDPAAPVQYASGAEAAERWHDFRHRLDQMLSAPYVPSAAGARAVQDLAAFDRFYAG